MYINDIYILNVFKLKNTLFMVFIKVLNPLALHLKNTVIMIVFEITNTE